MMPSSWHRLPALVSGRPIAAIASRNLAAVILNGRLPLLPHARAQAKPAIVRSATPAEAFALVA